ncbi:YafY family protein [Brenneria populi subsp. brevivirga]|uniref:helix-turn-helix transcriptional regulator n=1 Tax=Brenneria populi TaxID=1505588 RepID=UPI002E176F2E|nr:YafY family protein [Brenneria populi subsp. brevivirga]
MSRAQRLLDLLQILRRHRFPISGATLAAELNISLRTLYRDIGALQAQGADIAGEPGQGYLLRPGFMLPPLMFSEEEIEALALGSRWVAQRGDERLSAAARCALAKISAVLPDDLRDTLDDAALLVGPASSPYAGDNALSLIRQSIRAERKLKIRYQDLQGVESTRIIWPFVLGYFDHTRVLAAWCEIRQAFRHFRTERIGELEVLKERYPRRRQILLKTWRETKGIPPQ